MAYSEAHKAATYKYREANKERLQEKARGYNNKYYQLHRKERIAAVLRRREFLRLAQAAEAVLT